MIDTKKLIVPPDSYGPIPFWFWNDDCQEENIAKQLVLMKEQGIHEAILHARKGLSIPYLSETWFDRVRFACQKAKELGMKIWIYDENNWPSGYADGRVIAKNPAFSAKCLGVRKVYPVLGKELAIHPLPNENIERIIAVFQDHEFYDITSCGRDGAPWWTAPSLSWEVFVFSSQEVAHKPIFSNTPYVDLLNPEATDAFIEATHAEYKKHLGALYHEVVHGFFTDEPGFYQNYFEQDGNINTIAWTKDFCQRFKAIKGYDIGLYLPALFQNMPISPKIRRDYYLALDQFYKESYFNRIRSFLAPDGLLLIGHLHREERLEYLTQTEGDFFSAIQGLDIPGIDCIDREYPRVTEKLGASACDLFHKERCLSETFGCFGWKLTPEEMKERIDLQYAQGINLLVPHAFFSSIEGFRKKESPPSLFYQNPYYPAFHQISTYVSRLSYLLTRGQHAPQVAVYYPAKEAQEKFAPLIRRDVQMYDLCLQRLAGALFERGIDYILLDSDHLQSEYLKGIQAIFAPCELPLEKTSLPVYVFGETKDVKQRRYYYYEEEEAVEDLYASLSLPFRGKGFALYTRKDQAGSVLYFLVNLTDKPLSLMVDESVARSFAAVDLLQAKQKKGFTGKMEPHESLLLTNEKLSLPTEDNKAKTKYVLPLKEAYANDVSIFPHQSAHQANLSSYQGQIILIYRIEEKTDRVATLSFSGLKDYASVNVNGQELGFVLFYPFAIRVPLKRGTNVITVRIYGTLSNQIDHTDYDVGLSGDAFLEE